MDYEKKYKEALLKARDARQNTESAVTIGILEEIFPELRESEDEKIRKWLLNFVQGLPDDGLDFHFYNLNKEQVVAWLEKQGEQESITIDDDPVASYNNVMISDKIEPKFKVGNWYHCTKDFFGKGVTFDKNTAYYCAKEGCLQNEYGCHIAIVKDLYDNFKLWDISDAKDGDVLYHKAENGIEYIVMSKGLNENNNIDSYFRYNSINGFGIDIPSVLSAKNDSITPATKEQRDLLCQKMKEAGYEWDANKKQLKKNEQKLVEEKESLLKDLEWVDMETNECHCYNCELFDRKNNNCKDITLCKRPKSTYNGFYIK